jgi:hypothetical protein
MTKTSLEAILSGYAHGMSSLNHQYILSTSKRHSSRLLTHRKAHYASACGLLEFALRESCLLKAWQIVSDAYLKSFGDLAAHLFLLFLSLHFLPAP